MEDSKSLIHTSSSGPPDKYIFKYYKTITIDHNQVNGTGDHKNFPILISILDSDLHDQVQSDGSDIAFANDSDWLDHEIELFDQNYNTTHAHLIAWIRIPNLHTSIDTIICMYYGNSTMESQENPEGVWDSSYKGVWHLSEDPSGSPPQMKDSTSKSNHGMVSNLNTSDQENGQIDGSIDFDDDYDLIDCGNDTSLNMGSGEFSLSMWFNYDGVDWGAIAGKGAVIQGKRYYLSFNTPAGQIRAEIDDDSEPVNPNIISGESYGDNKWHHLVMVRDEAYLRLYLDGNEDGTRSVTSYGSIDSIHPFYMNAICGDNSGQITSWSSVKLDEVRVSNSARSAGWIATEFNNQNDTNSFYSVSTAQMTLSPSHFKYYKEITIDHTKVFGIRDFINYPLLISIFDSDLQNHTQPDGDDIAFYNGTEWLDHEIDEFNQNYNETHARLIAWVRIPILYNSKDTIIYMYYGNSTLISMQNPSGVWDSIYKGVWHLGEGITNPSSYYYDSTTNNNNGKAMNSPINDTTSKIDGGVSFDDSNERAVKISNSSSLQFVSNFSISAWFRSTDSDNDVGLIMNKWGGEESKRNYWLGKLNQNDFAFFVDNNSNVLYGWTNLNDGDWHYVVATANDTSIVIYIDGLLVASNSWDGISITGNADLYIGKATDTIDQEFNGDIDEVRVIDTALDLDWIKTEFSNQNDPDNFYSVNTAKTVLSIYDFKYYKEIVIDNTKVNGSENLINFPILIKLRDSDLQAYAQPDGDDIAFYDGSNWLDYEIELFNQTYNETHAQLIAWVRVPSLSPSIDTKITMYFGNNTMGSHQNPKGVWTTDYKAVWHLKEDPGPGNTGDIKDSTSNDNDGTAAGTMTSDDQISGQIDGTIDFDGGDDYIGVNDIGSFTNLTISAWIKPKGWGQGDDDYIHQIIGDEEIFTDATFSFRIGSQGLESYKQRLGLGINISSTWLDFESLSNLSLNTWQYVAVTFDGNDIKFYIDGNNDNTQSNSGNIINTGNDWNIGGVTNENFRYFDGNIDELRIAETPFTADWIATEFNNQFDPKSFFTISSKEKLDNTPPTYENLVESSDPLELGEIEIITTNISDPFGINQALIEFEDSDYVIRNHTMINIGGDTWQYDSWQPSSVGNHNYTIWMEDNYINWNSTIGTIEVIDTTPPTYSDLIINADPLQIGENQTITIKVFDDPGSGVNQTLLEYDSVNHTMVFIGNNTWNWSKWKPTSEGIHSYKIYIQDMQNNWKIITGNFIVKDMTTTIKENLGESMFIIIIVIILASVIGSLTIIVLVKRKLKKEIIPSRKKIPFKIISSHLNKLTSPKFTLQEEEIQSLTKEKEIEIRINEIKNLGEELFAEGAYLEAQEQFKLGRDLLINLEREEEAKLFSDLISGIEGLIEEREKRLQILEKVKGERNSVEIFELYQEIITISHKLKDTEAVSFYQSELVNYFQNNDLKLVDLEKYRFELNQKAELSIENNIFETAAQLYEKCEKISQLLEQLGREEEIKNIEAFRTKKAECLKRIP